MRLSISTTMERRVCVLANQPHTTHPIIRRELTTLQRAGYKLTVVDRDDRVRAVSLGGPAKQVWRVLRRLDEQGLGELWWTIVYFAEVLLTGFRFWAAAVRERPDLYLAHDLETLLPAIAAARLRRRPVIYDAHEVTSEQGDPRSMRKRVERWLEQLVVPRVDYLVAPNAPRAQLYERRYGVRKKPIVVRNCPPVVNVKRTDLLRQELGLSASTRIVVYHGALMEGRALDNLVRATSDFDEDIVLVLIGAQAEYFQRVLRPLAQSVRDPERVQFIPFVEPDRVLDYVASADLGVVIYQNINLNNYLCAPTKLYEYLMVGLPIVASAFPEIREVLDQLPVGRAFDPEDPSSIAAAVNAFFRTRAQNKQAIEAGLNRARQQFTWEQESRKLLKVFEEAVG